MISFENVTFRYDGAPRSALCNVNLAVEEGSLALIAGATGSGKSTLLRLINGLVPHFSGGHLAGQVVVDGVSTRQRPPRSWAQSVGYVAQEPRASFVTDRVEDELAYGMEQLGFAPSLMRLRVEATLDLLGIAALRDRHLTQLSGGEAQRVAIGAALAAGPQILVLDEPTSALDPAAAEDVLSTLARLVHDLGMTVMLAEHRLERAVQFADQMVYIGSEGQVSQGLPDEVLSQIPTVPPIIELGRLAGWKPLPVSVRDARRLAGPLRTRLEMTPSLPSSAANDPKADQTEAGNSIRPVIMVRDLSVVYGSVTAVQSVSLEVNAGQISALMGRNGSGKSSLLWAINGLGPRAGGTVQIDGQDPAVLNPAQARALVALVPDEPADLLYLDSVEAEIGTGPARAILTRLAPQLDLTAHPRDLSEGQRLAVVLALQLAPGPRAILLDEPTRGLDYQAKTEFTAILRDLAAQGHAILLVTHDVEFAAAATDQVMTIAQGELIDAGPAAAVLAAAAAHAPQVVRILGPAVDCLTVAEVRQRLTQTSA